MPFGAYIVEAVRTPAGKRNGLLAKWQPAQLGAVVVDELVKRTGIDGGLVDDVIFGCVDQVGAQSGNLGRAVVLSSHLPEHVPGTTVDRQCGSSQQAIHFAAQAVMSGTQDCVIAGGVEIMSLCPIGSGAMDGIRAGHGAPFQTEGIREKYGDVQFSQFDGAEILAKRFDLSREHLEDLAVNSHKRAHEATTSGRFAREIVPVTGLDKEGNKVTMTKDEGIRPQTTKESLAKLKTLRPDGKITAATASQISDGAAAIMICNEKGLLKLGVKPRAKIISLAVIGSDPVTMLYGPVPATKIALQKSGLSLDQMDLYEVNEAFSSVPATWMKELNADVNKLNVNGGAMALGHPLGATGAKLMTTLLHEMERRNATYGLQAICEGGGTANATILERISNVAKL